MEKRVLLAIFLSFLVLYIFQGLFVTPKPKPAAAVTAGEMTGSGTSGAAATVAVGAQAPGQPAAAAQAAAGAAPVVAGSTEREIRVETDYVDAEFTNRGGELQSWRLKRYKNPDGKPVQLVVTELLKRYPAPFSLKVNDPTVTRELNDALYAVRGATGNIVDARTKPATLTFEYQNAAGLRVEKIFHIEPKSYVLTFKVSAASGGRTLNPTIEWGPGLGDAWNAVTSRYVQQPEGLIFHSSTGKVERLSPSNISKQTQYQGHFGYVGVDDNYFMSTLLFPPTSVQITYEPLSVPTSSAPKAAVSNLVAYAVQPATGGAPLQFFVGPKDFDLLSGINRNLVRAINFGWFSFLVVPLLRALQWIDSYVGNYGWSIIILTILINLAIFPLRHKSVVSMRKMSQIQPEIKAIQARYAKLKATDPARQKMNVEMMNLYKEKGVNPASGCLPMLLTLPILYAIYSLLEVAIEIRGAPFIGWITDLSVHDPLYITPVLMGISMVWQQKMQPSTVDPMQRKMMMFMPVIFTVMFLWAPSGLVLYWLVSNLWGIGQQTLTNYLIGPPVVKAVRPPAERRVKRVGTGKTEAATREN